MEPAPASRTDRGRVEGRKPDEPPLTINRETAGPCHTATDANGHLVLGLLAGEYGILRGHYPNEGKPTTVPLTWTASGPLQARVQL